MQLKEMLWKEFPFVRVCLHLAMGTAAFPKGFGAHLILYRGMSGVGVTERTLYWQNRHMYCGGVRYFIPFCCEQSCKKPFYTSHTDKPLTKQVAGWRKSRDRTSPASFPRLTFRPPLLSTVLPPRPVMVMGVTSTSDFCQWKFYISLVTMFLKTWGKSSKPCRYSAANLLSTPPAYPKCVASWC